jgi:hypothetical protein
MAAVASYAGAYTDAQVNVAERRYSARLPGSPRWVFLFVSLVAKLEFHRQIRTGETDVAMGVAV